jgi:hypothetical protein
MVLLNRVIKQLTVIRRDRRQEVPDTQEVFRYDQSDAVIVVEVIARVEPTDTQQAVMCVDSKLGNTS